MYYTHMKNAIVLQLIASVLYVVLSLALSKHSIFQTLPIDLSFGLATFLITGLLALWGFQRYHR